MIIIPAYNEASNIVRVVEELKCVVPQFDYVVVNKDADEAARQIMSIITAEKCRYIRNSGIEKTI